MKLGIVFYHPKNPQNLWDLARIAWDVSALLYVIPRPRADYKLERLPGYIRRSVRIVERIEEVVKENSDATFIVLETYGEELIINANFAYDKLVVVVGAEDYGIPREEISKLPNAKVYLLPVSVEGASYNVVTATVIALYEIKRFLELEKREGDSFRHSMRSNNSVDFLF